MRKIVKTSLNESLNIEKRTPKIFNYTKYDYPSKEDLIDINSCNLTSDDIVQGFSYSIIGRGIKDSNKIKMIQDSIQMLVNIFPENNIYKEALEKSYDIKPRFK